MDGPRGALFHRLPRRLALAAGRPGARPRPHRMTTESQLRADIVEVGRRMYARGYTAPHVLLTGHVAG